LEYWIKSRYNDRIIAKSNYSIYLRRTVGEIFIEVCKIKIRLEELFIIKISITENAGRYCAKRGKRILQVLFNKENLKVQKTQLGIDEKQLSRSQN
jgi:hypothetical protein